MFENFEFVYLAGSLIVGFPIWSFLFLYRKDLRKEMLISSLAIGLLAPLWEPWFLTDYWHPESLNTLRVGIGDFAYGFFFGGIGNVIYEVVCGKHFSKRKDRKYHWSWFLLPFVALSILVFNVPFMLGLKSIYAAIIMFLLFAFAMVFFRKDLFLDAIVSGLLMGIITVFGYFIFIYIFPGVVDHWWKLENLWGVSLIGIPLEEIVWAFGMGMVIGPLYEFFGGLRFNKN